MNGQDLFKVDRSADRLNESFFRMFGKKLNLETFDLEQLQDARNRLRTQISQIRSQSNFNETVENDNYLQAKMMLDAINAEIAERDEHIVESDVEEGAMKDVDYDLRMIANDGDEDELISALQGDMGSGVADVLNDMMSELQDELAAKGMNDVIDDNDKMIELLWDKLVDEYGGDDEYNDDDMDSSDADADALKSAGFGSDEDYESVQNEKAPDAVRNIAGAASAAVGGLGGALLGNMFAPMIGGVAGGIGGAIGGAKVGSETADAIWDKVSSMLGGEKQAEQAGIAHAKAAKAGETSFEFDGKEYEVTLKPQEVGKAVADLKAVKEAYAMEVSPPGFKGTVKAMKKHDDIDNPYALAWHMKKKGYKSHKKADGSDKKESVTRGEDMTTLQEGEVQQASAIVTAKTMVDRVGRWIEELSGMENETLLQLGDSIRDEMGQEQSRAFIEAVAPAIQSALETLKGTRETISNGVNTLATGEAPADMLGAEPEGGDMGSEEAPMDMEMPAEEPTGDEFAAAEPAAGGAEEAGRQQRESIERQNKLLKVLAG